ncbi:E3 ubiquitin-protein ligase SHPRH [Protopterus annectens]|uniref:E3 ubiquitin-protein ligase SHPRH n=1 Tax=Protopterus annectens TaxID=7888 RepID=UPI001CFC4062|nr:E3 ubiquitin-protein ligase SHPRH [Protopterus annectens]
MSSRRKSAAPVKVDEEAKKKLCWSMHDGIKDDCFTLDSLQDDSLPGPSSLSSSFLIVQDDTVDEELNCSREQSSSSFLQFVEDGEESYSSLPPVSILLNLTVSSMPSDCWMELLGEFSLELVSGQLPIENINKCTFSLKKASMGGKLLNLALSKEEDTGVEDNELYETLNSHGELYSVECSLRISILEDFMWLQKKRVLGLYHRHSERCDALKVGIYLLESGLAKPNFLSEACGRIRKANQLIQKLMDFFYNFEIPDVLDEDGEESDRELERQNIEELYDYVRYSHQQDVNRLREDVQHPALIPVLRPYQSEAVSWMLQREHFKGKPTNDNMLHFLWREFTTPEGTVLYYNPFTGSIIQERPLAGPEWPGGILADEMGLGKTVEVLALILIHTRQNLTQDILTLPEGLSVNYFIPAPPTEKEKKVKEKQACLQPKEKVNHPSLRVMILTAVKEMKVKQSVSIKAIFKYIGTIYNYNVQRNLRFLKKTMEKLISEKVLEQVTGHGMMGSFRLGKNNKEVKKCTGTAKQVKESQSPSNANVRKSPRKSLPNDAVDSKPEATLERPTQNELSDGKILQDCNFSDHDYCMSSEIAEHNVVEKTDVKSEDFTSSAAVKSEDDGKEKGVENANVCIISQENVVDNKKDEKDNLECSVSKEHAVVCVTEVENTSLEYDIIHENIAGHDMETANASLTCISSKEYADGHDMEESNISATEDCTESSNDGGRDVIENPLVQCIGPDKGQPATQHTPVFPFSTADYRFECICGDLGLVDYKARVQCLNCQLWQHAECVNYKKENLGTMAFYCPHCLVAMKPVSTGATLIISPSSICHQWVEEINRHISSSSLRVLVYQGVKKHGFLQPHLLAEQDVVITTYDILRSELNYVDIPHSNSEDGRRFRNQKRYMAIPSPLVAVEWWRVCLDEAQMVECTTAKAAEMALRLSAVNRWCVTGTPVQRGLEDLYGLVLFLGVDPYWVRHWWDQLLYRPYCRKNHHHLYNLISKIMWRSAKKDVLDQIQIPPQTEEVHWLHFSPVERHFYQRQHDVCSQDALVKLRKISDWSLKLSSLDRRTVSTILYPVLRLRQACCHPQAVRGEFLPLQKSTMTMEELLKSLQKKCRTECEEAHRQLVCALNGLAGVHIIRAEYTCAAELYREVLRSSEEHKDKLKTDSLQRLHATHNLMELLEAKHPGIPPTLRDDRLKEEAEQLQKHYMSKSDAEVAEAHQALQPVLHSIRELHRKVHPGSPWWLDIIQCAVQYAIDEELVLRVKNELTSNYKQQSSKLTMGDKFHDCRGLQFLLTTQMDELKKSQKIVRDAVKKLEGPPTPDVIQAATICHLRPVRLPLNNCVFCKADELFTDYESKLFSHTVKGQTAIFEEMIEDEEGLVDDRLPTTSRGLWAASETERALKAVLSFSKTHRMDTSLIEEGNAFMELFEAWKKEYKLLHEYWMVLRDHVSAIDELAMATERLRVRHPDEAKPAQHVHHIIEPHEVEQTRVKLLNDKAVATSQLQKKLGQLLYLRNLEKSQDKTTGGVNPEPCPICSRELGKQWAVLTCGHCFCNECVAIMVEQYSVGMRRSSIKCAICRQTTSHKEISYVFTAETADMEEDVPVKGSHSTKVEAVVRTLKKIQLKDPGAKALVFSTWQDVLDIISNALTENNMEFAQINGIHKFQENLCMFKYDPAINILLLPLHTGSNGLNIIEATHVLLVEPILNPAHELQAIGRVHRIGQTRPTFVHRFLIKATIEERMQSMLKTADRSHSSSSMKQSEASALTVADLADLFTEENEELE